MKSIDPVDGYQSALMKLQIFECDSLIIAVGQGPNPVITRKTPNIAKG